MPLSGATAIETMDDTDDGSQDPRREPDRTGPGAPDRVRHMQEAHLQLALAAANLGTWHYDERDGGLYLDERCCELLGMALAPTCSPGEVMQRLHPDDREPVMQAVRHAFAAQTADLFIYEFRVLQAGGVVRWIQGRGHVHFEDVEGTRRPVYAAGVVMDVTRRRRHENQLKALNEQLEERVRTRVEQVRRLAGALTLSEQRERQRIAQVLHGDLQQILYGLQITLNLVQTATSADEKAALWAQALETLGQALDTTSALTMELSPPVLAEGDLEPILTWLASQYDEQYGLAVEVELRNPAEIPDPDLRILIYQFLRELLFNVVKHAETDHARLVAWTEPGIVHVRVEDGGVGFDPVILENMAPSSEGLGLISMRERLQLLGGDLGIVAKPGKGVIVELTVPIHDADAGQAA